MRRFLLILFLTLPCALIFPAPAKTPAPPIAPVKKAPLPKVAVLVSFDGYSDFYEFTASQDNYNLSAVYQSLMFQLYSYSSNLLFVETNKMMYIPLSAAEDKKAIDIMGLDYLIKLNMVKWGKGSALTIGGLRADGTWIISERVDFYGKMVPYSFENVYNAVNKTITGITLDAKAQNLKKSIGGTNYIWMTNYNNVYETNTISAIDLTGVYPIRNFLFIIGDFGYVETVNSYNTKCYTNKKNAFSSSVDIYPGLNFLRFSYNNASISWNSWDMKNEQIFLINNISLTNSSLTLNDFRHVPVSHLFLSIGMKKYYSISDVFIDLDFGFRFALSASHKIKLAMTLVERWIYSYYGGYYLPELGIKVGYESRIGDFYTPVDYTFCWFVDGIASFKKLGLNCGISLRPYNILAINMGFGINYFPVSISSSSTGPDSWDVSLFITYEFFFYFPHAYKNYELNY